MYHSGLRFLQQLDEPGLGLNREYIIHGLENESVKAYYDYMVDTAKMLGADEDRAKKEMSEVVKFETALAKVCPSRNSASP